MRTTHFSFPFRPASNLWLRRARSFWLGALALVVAAGGPAFALTGKVTETSTTLLPNTRYETSAYVVDSGVSGPTVMIVGGVHGNEPAGALAAESIRHWPIVKGRLVLVPRANVTALAANKRLIPNLETNLSNLNRNYPRAGKEEKPRGELAEAIWNLALKYKPDWLLDLHEGYDFHQLNENSVGSSIIVFPNDEGKTAANIMLAAVNVCITNPTLKFVLRNMPIDGSLARAGGEHLKIPSMTLETTSRQPMEKRIQQHEIMVGSLFHYLGMTEKPAQAIASSEVKPEIHASRAESRPDNAPLRIALYKGPGTGGAGPPNLLQRLQQPPACIITEITPAEIQENQVTNFDLVIFAGGSGSKQGEALAQQGRDNVRTFVANGGGYIGICAGAYLATSGYPWSLHLVNARTISPKWKRGRGEVRMEFTGDGREILGERKGPFNVLYANGPVVQPANVADLPPYHVLSWFRSEMASNDSPAGIMINSPAIFSGEFKSGRVVCISPHPEQTKGLDDIVPHAVAWAAPRKVSTKILFRAE